MAWLVGLLASPVEAGPLWSQRARSWASRPVGSAGVSWTWPRLARSALTAQPQTMLAPASTAAGGPFADYFRWALQTQTLQVAVPQMLRNLQPASNGQLPAWAFVDYLRWRRSLNPARFDYYHPRVGQMLQWEPPIPQGNPPPTTTPPVDPQGQNPRPPVTPPPVIPPPEEPPPVIPEPSTALIMASLFAAGWWARRRRARLQEPDGGSA